MIDGHDIFSTNKLFSIFYGILLGRINDEFFLFDIYEWFLLVSKVLAKEII